MPQEPVLLLAGWWGLELGLVCSWGLPALCWLCLALAVQGCTVLVHLQQLQRGTRPCERQKVAVSMAMSPQGLQVGLCGAV